LMAKSRLVTIRPSSKRFSIQDIGDSLYVVNSDAGRLLRAPLLEVLASGGE
jgi:hypothetical protein